MSDVDSDNGKVIVTAGNSKEAHKDPTVEHLLKQVYTAHSKKVGALKTKVKELRSRLKDVLGSPSTCSECGKEVQHQDELKHYYEVRLQEKDRIIHELINKGRTKKCENKNPIISSVTNNLQPPSKKRKVLSDGNLEGKSRHTCDSSDFVMEPSATAIYNERLMHNVDVLTHKNSKNSMEGPVLSDCDEEFELQCLVPETVYDPMEEIFSSPRDIIIPETVPLECEESFSTSLSNDDATCNRSNEIKQTKATDRHFPTVDNVLVEPKQSKVARLLSQSLEDCASYINDHSNLESEVQVLVPETSDYVDENIFGSPCDNMVHETLPFDVEAENAYFNTFSGGDRACISSPKSYKKDDTGNRRSSVQEADVHSTTVPEPETIHTQKKSPESECSIDYCEIFPAKESQRLQATDLRQSVGKPESKWIRKKSIVNGYNSASVCNSKSYFVKNKLKTLKTVQQYKQHGDKSKYLMTFEPVCNGYHKPKYKQMTLTQNLFLEKQKDNNTECQISKKLKQDMENLSSSCTIARKNIDANGALNRHSLINHSAFSKVQSKDHSSTNLASHDSDLDSTYVPPNLVTNLPTENESIDTASASIDETESNLNVPEDDVVADDSSVSSEDLLQEMFKQSPVKNMKVPEQNTKPTHSLSKNKLTKSCIHEFGDDENDFDIVPTTSVGPNYKYKHDVVRKKDERRKLEGRDCRECEAYFASLKLSEEEVAKRLKECSRHREKHVVPNTPEHYWSLDFPSTRESSEKDVLNNTQYRPLQKRRLRKLTTAK